MLDVFGNSLQGEAIAIHKASSALVWSMPVRWNIFLFCYADWQLVVSLIVVSILGLPLPLPLPPRPP